MFVKMRLPMGKTMKSALLVPDSAMQEDQGGRYVFVVGPDDVVQQRYVQLGSLVGNLRVVTSGIKADDRVVVGELWRAVPGIKVTPHLTASASRVARDDVEIFHRASGSRQCAGDRAGRRRRRVA